MFELNDKVALRTGATGGIGGAIAKQMHAAGATVIVSGRSLEKLDAQFGDEYIKIAADIAADGAAEKLIADAIAAAGRVDILVNNAGITRDGLLMRMTDAQFDEVINTNLRSTFKMTPGRTKETSEFALKASSTFPTFFCTH